MRFQEFIVVEGHHDKIAVDRAVEADCIITGGFAISKQLITKVRLAQERRGVIILTDPDYAGEQIRQRISRAVPGCKHAFIAKEAAMKGADVGVENASPEEIRYALERLRTLVSDPPEEFQWFELVNYGLTGQPTSAWQRNQLGKLLGIGYANAKQFHRRLNAFGITRREFDQALAGIGRCE